MSARKLRITLVVLAAVGVCLAAYLTYVHYSGVEPPCSIKGNPCSQVQKSRYSELIGIPVALMGLIGYIVILGSLLVREDERTRFATAALTLGGFGFSAYLTYREVFTLEKICEWCVGSAVLMTIMVCLSAWRFLRGGDGAPQHLAPVDVERGAGEQASPLGAAHP
jgi:uncharacterized membrane protein